MINRSFAFESTGPTSSSAAAKNTPTTWSSAKFDGKFAKNRQGSSNNLSGSTSVTAIGTSSANNGVMNNVICVVCKQNHFLDLCSVFLQKSVNDRVLIIKHNRLCLRCFKPNHSVTSRTRNIKCTMSRPTGSSLCALSSKRTVFLSTGWVEFCLTKGQK